jgi:hypothetical protein
LTVPAAAFYGDAMRGGLVLLFVLGCTTGGEMDRDAGSRDAAGRDSGGRDAGARPCATPADCDDGIACTIDSCGVGAVCRNMPEPSMCAEGETCSPAQGCTVGCDTDPDCDNGVFCDGAERCLAGDCYDGTAPDCADGNACTTDVCDPGIDGCRYEVAPGCDAGTLGRDAGPSCDAFDPDTHLSGTFRVLPAPSSDCLSFSFRVTTAAFSTTASALSIRADRFTLTEAPVPDGADFHATFSDSCASYQLSGTFDCADQFTGRWVATPTGGDCTICPGQDQMVIGVRR